jgi:mercuric ion transport protein
MSALDEFAEKFGRPQSAWTKEKWKQAAIELASRLDRTNRTPAKRGRPRHNGRYVVAKNGKVTVSQKSDHAALASQVEQRMGQAAADGRRLTIKDAVREELNEAIRRHNAAPPDKRGERNGELRESRANAMLETAYTAFDYTQSFAQLASTPENWATELCVIKCPQRGQKGRLMATRWMTPGAMFAGAATAIGASACCAGPLLLVVLGFGGAWITRLTALEPFQPFFIAAGVTLFGFAFYRLYRKPVDCLPGQACATPAVRRRQRAVVWIVALSAAALMAFPLYAPLFY